MWSSDVCTLFCYFLCCAVLVVFVLFFFFNDTATTEIYTLSLHDALPISAPWTRRPCTRRRSRPSTASRSEEHTSELQSRGHLVCRLLLEKKKKNIINGVKRPNKDDELFAITLRERE